MSICIYRIYVTVSLSYHAAALQGPRSVVMGASPVHELTRSTPFRMGTGVEVRVRSAAALGRNPVGRVLGNGRFCDLAEVALPAGGFPLLEFPEVASAAAGWSLF